MSTSVELRHLRAFVAVAEELHFTRAAARLHLAQQGLSDQIQRLEREVGTSLFHRTTRSVELTDAGHVLVEHARSILAAVDTALERTRGAGAGQLGRLAIAYTPTVAYEALPLLTAAVHAETPQVQVRTVEMWQADAVAAVRHGRFDVGFARAPTLVDGLDSIVIRQEQLGVILGCEHPAAANAGVDPVSLSGASLMIWPRELSPGYYELVVDGLRSHGFAGEVAEFENLSRSTVFADDAARAEVSAARAFSIGFATEPLQAGFVWRPLRADVRIPLDLFWTSPARPIVARFVRLARDVAQRERWLPALVD